MTVVAAVFGIIAMVFSFLNNYWHTPAQVLAQLCGAGLMAATLLFQYKTTRAERRQYYADRNSEEFMRYVDVLASSVYGLCLTKLNNSENVRAESAFKELVERYDTIVDVLSATEFRYFDTSVDTEMEQQEYEGGMLLEAADSEIGYAAQKSRDMIRAERNERNRRKSLCDFYGINKVLWQEYYMQDKISISNKAIELLLSHHQEYLHTLFSSYATLNYFLQLHPSYRKSKIDGTLFLYSKFSCEHYRFFTLWVSYCQSNEIAYPTMLTDLLQKAKDINFVKPFKSNQL